MSENLIFGSWLKQRRKELGLTQEEVAEHIGCSPSALQKIENGERRPSGQVSHLLALYLRIPTDEREAFVTFARSGQSASAFARSPHGSPAPNPHDEIAQHAPWRVSYRSRTNLPAVLTPLIGREQEVAEALNQLRNPRTRLLTLVGAPGIGKTRLALQIASDMVEHFEDGVYFVELAPVTDPEQVLPAIARALDLHEGGKRSMQSLLLDYLQRRRMLLVLDNFEQILDASTAVVMLMEASPWLKVMVTSREALRVRGERRFLVPPLVVPDLSRLTSIEELAGYPSVELFVERAQAVAPDFTVTEANAGDVAAVCAGLEGLPLAIELAAARANLLSPAEMRSALSSRLKLLAATTRDLPARQRTLRGAIKWSYDLLSEEEQALFRGLGVFVGGFTSEAVAEVCSVGHGRADATSGLDTLDMLHALVEHNLVKQDKAGNETDREIVSGSSRFRLWETIREFALEQLEESGEDERVRRGHALYFRKLAKEAMAQLLKAEQAKWLERLELEHDNLRAALRWAMSPNRGEPEQVERSLRGEESKGSIDTGEDREALAAEVGLGLAGDIQQFWRIRGYLSEGREHLTAVLTLPGASPDLQLARALVFNGAGLLASEQGDFAAARTSYEESLAIHRELGDKPGTARALSNLAGVVLMLEDFETARAHLDEGLALWREVGEKNGIAVALDLGGLAAFLEAAYSEARVLYEESLALRREMSNSWGMALTLYHLANTAYMQDDFAAARALHEESLGLQHEIGHNWGIALSFAGLGAVASGAGEAERGARLLGAADAHRESLEAVLDSEDRSIFDRGLASARAQLDEETWQKAWQEGRTMSMEEAIEYALGIK